MDDQVVLASRLRISRNLSGEKFDLSAPELDSLKEKITGLQGPWSQWTFHRPRDLPPLVRQRLMETGHLEPDFIFRPGGWLAVDPQGRRSLSLGNDDHFRYAALSPGESLTALQEESSSFLQALESNFPPAFDPELGFLRADPRQCGTAAKPSLVLHLPASEHSGLITEVLLHCEGAGYSTRGLWEGDEEGPALYQVSPHHSTGSSEIGALLQLENLARKIRGWEAKARDILVQRRLLRVEDLCARARGILTNARILPLSEALTQVSRLRLGVIMGIIEDIPPETVTGLFFGMQTGALRGLMPDCAGEEDDELRARWIRSRLSC